MSGKGPKRRFWKLKLLTLSIYVQNEETAMHKFHQR